MGGQLAGDVERRLPAELHDDAGRLLFLVDAEHVLDGQRLEVELVGGVIVGRNRFRVAVDHDRFVALVAQREGGVHAAVVELDALADAVRTAAQHHDLLRVRGGLALVRGVVGRVVVGGVFDAAHRHGVPAFHHADAPPLLPDGGFFGAHELRQILVGETVLLGAPQQFVGQCAAAELQDLLFQLHQLPHLVDEVGLDEGLRVKLLVVAPLRRASYIRNCRSLVGWESMSSSLREGPRVEVLGEAQPVAADLQRPDGFLQSLLVGLADAHGFAHGAHLRAQLVLGAAELLEGPAREFDHHVVARRRVLVERAALPVGDLVERQAGGELRRNQRDGESSRLGSQGRRTRSARVDFDHYHAAGLRIVSELDVGAADHLDRFHDAVGILLKLGLQLRRDREHGRRAVGVAGVHAHGVHVLDEADGDHLVLGVADHLQLEFLPAEHRLFHQDLSHQAGGDSAARHHLQLLDVVDQAATRSAHGVGGPDHDRVSQLGGDAFGLFHRERRRAARHLDAQAVHGLFERDAVFAAFDGVHLHADHLDPIPVQDARCGPAPSTGSSRTGLPDSAAARRGAPLR